MLCIQIHNFGFLSKSIFFTSFGISDIVPSFFITWYFAKTSNYPAFVSFSTADLYLNMPTNAAERRRSAPRVNRGRAATYFNESWSMDFVTDSLFNGHRFRALTLVDNFSRECLAIVVNRRINSQDVLYALTDLFIRRGIPAHIRSDNGSGVLRPGGPGVARKTWRRNAVHRAVAASLQWSATA
jgi:putative transposase